MHVEEKKIFSLDKIIIRKCHHVHILKELAANIITIIKMEKKKHTHIMRSS